jgi:multiple sugar transport system substrate-binding protein
MKKWMLLLTFALCLTLAACGGGDTTNSSPDPSTSANQAPASTPAQPEETVSGIQTEINTPVEIEFWHAMTGAHEEALNRIVEQFNAESELITVKAVSQGSYSDLQQKIMASARANTLPALSQVTTNVVPEYMRHGFIVSLDEYIYDERYGLTDEEFTDIVEIFREAGQWDGMFYAMPFSKSTRVLFYNKGLLEEHHLNVPETWDDIRQIAETVTGNGMVGMGFENSFEMEFESLLRQMGGEYVNEEAMEARFASEAGIRAMSLIQNMIEEGIARTAGEDGYMSNPFGRGDVAMYIGSSAGIPFVRSAAEGNIDWSVTVLPTFEGKAATPFAGNDVVIYNQSTDEQKLAAWEFVKFLISPEISAQWAMDSGYLPVRYSALELPAYKSFKEENPEQGVGELQFDAGYFSARVPGASAVRTHVLDELEEIVLGRKSVEEGLQAAQDKANQALQDS